MDAVRRYFPELSSIQHEMLDQLAHLYSDWNTKINVISRKDMDFFRERHVLHSLAIFKIIQFLILLYLILRGKFIIMFPTLNNSNFM